MKLAFIEDKTFTGTDFQKTLFEIGEYENCKFINCDFSNVNLSEIVFSDCKFTGCNLSLIKLTKKLFASANSMSVKCWDYISANAIHLDFLFVLRIVI